MRHLHLRGLSDSPLCRMCKAEDETSAYIFCECEALASLLKLNRSQLRMITAVYTGHAPVRGHLFTIGLFEGDPICRCCGMGTETVQHIVCRCEVLARQKYVFGKLIIEPKDISTASIRDLCFFIHSAGLLRLC
jgi:hypothetical protein